jgi:hypothetical protein
MRVTGLLASLLGRYDSAGRLQHIGRTTTLAQATGTAIAGHPTLRC